VGEELEVEYHASSLEWVATVASMPAIRAQRARPLDEARKLMNAALSRVLGVPSSQFVLSETVSFDDPDYHYCSFRLLRDFYGRRHFRRIIQGRPVHRPNRPRPAARPGSERDLA
jgi:hypothetical protein